MWIGRLGVVVLTDPEHVRYAGNKLLNHPAPPVMLRDKNLREVEASGLLAMRWVHISCPCTHSSCLVSSKTTRHPGSFVDFGRSAVCRQKFSFSCLGLSLGGSASMQFRKRILPFFIFLRKQKKKSDELRKINCVHAMCSRSAPGLPKFSKHLASSDDSES